MKTKICFCCKIEKSIGEFYKGRQCYCKLCIKNKFNKGNKMKAERISITIGEICAKLGIDYCTVNPHYLQMINDAKRLGEIIRDLKIIAGDLEAIADRHDIDGLKNLIHEDALQIEKIDHEIVKLAKQIKDKEND